MCESDDKGSERANSLLFKPKLISDCTTANGILCKAKLTLALEEHPRSPSKDFPRLFLESLETITASMTTRSFPDRSHDRYWAGDTIEQCTDSSGIRTRLPWKPRKWPCHFPRP